MIRSATRDTVNRWDALSRAENYGFLVEDVDGVGIMVQK